MAKNTVVKLVPGQRGKVVWVKNDRPGMPPVKSTEFDGKKTDKVILPAGECPAKPGETWYVQVLRDTNPKARDKGSYLVQLLKKVFVLDLGPTFWIDVDVASEIAQDLSVQANIMLVGPQGCGKTVLVSAIAKAMGYVFSDINGAGVRRPSDWYAVRDVRSDGQGGQEIIWIERPLAKALREAAADLNHKHLIFVDELNRGTPEARNALLTVVYGEERHVVLPSGERVEVGGNVQFVCAINEGGEFSGLGAADAAFDDRWARHKLTYPPENAEVDLLRARESEAKTDDLRQIVRIANMLRELARKGEIPKQISMRMTQTAARRLASGSSLKRAVVSAIVNQFQGNHEDAASDAGIVWSKIKGRYGIS